MLDNFVKNLTNVAPNKGEAKKTVSQGLIRLSFSMEDEMEYFVWGMATDDVMAVSQREPILIKEFQTVANLHQVDQYEWVGYFLPETLKNWMLGRPIYDVDSPYDREFDHKFWLDHVDASIIGYGSRSPALSVTINPDRLRKFSLLEPRGLPLQWEFREWADQSVIRWRYGKAYGVYAPLDIEEK